MNQEQPNPYNDDNEIIDVKPFFNAIKEGFKGILKTLVAIVLFYKKNIALFAVLLILGAIGGYFLDKKLKITKIFSQEIIIEPKYETNKYIYDFIDGLAKNLNDKAFLEKLQIDSSQVSEIKEITLEPIIQATDVLDGLHVKYGDQDYFHHIIEEYDEKTLEDDKYRDFYKYHRLKFDFNSESSDNKEVSKALLSYIASNEYYNKQLSLQLKQTKRNLEKNKETLLYVEEYLDKLNKNQGKQNKEIVVYAEESEIPTISSLLKRKNDLLNAINQQERTLTLDKELFEVVEYGNIIPQPVGVHKRLLLLLPLILCVGVSMIFLLLNISRRINSFIKD
ncbi:hypothetical protein [Aquimarina rubra]|uniref:Polysaccharide chain length determinant N-terminal domain-containing protein n=1 Tax=Aquimarina rubra TaxID=1920033 RepID=A0ABW5LH91_9FLAO